MKRLIYSTKDDDFKSKMASLNNDYAKAKTKASLNNVLKKAISYYNKTNRIEFKDFADIIRQELHDWQ